MDHFSEHMPLVMEMGVTSGTASAVGEGMAVGEGLSLLGADDALANQYITLQVKSIDHDKLKLKLGGKTGTIASSAMTFVDAAPKAVLDIATPLIKKTAADYGVELGVTVSNVPPKGKGRALSEFWPGLVAGIVLGGSSLAIVKIVMKVFGRR